jgi:hypothetical protein
VSTDVDWASEENSARTWRIIGGLAAMIGGAAAFKLARNRRQRLGAAISIVSGLITLATEIF